MSVIIRGARIMDPGNGFDGVADLMVKDGEIAAVGDCSSVDGGRADSEIEASGKWLLPGLVDVCARLGEPGYSHRGTIASETRAAAAGGFTTVSCPPDCNPVLDTTAAARHLFDRIRDDALVRVQPIAALTRDLAGEQLSDMHALKMAGCLGVGNALHPVTDTHVLRCAMQYAASLDLAVFLTPVDPWLAGHGCVHQGRTATRLGLPGIPAAAEVAAVARDLVLVADTGVRAHFGRLSTARAVQLIAQARCDGLPVTADVAMHQLFLTEMDVNEFDSNAHLVPPLRSQDDREALRQGLASGAIAAVCSDHMPHDRDAKLAPFPETEPGIAALETTLALGLRLVHEEVLALSDLVARLTVGPAKVLGIDAGRLGIGQPADLCLVDPEAAWSVARGQWFSQGGNTPFQGWEFHGRVVQTMVAGETVHTL